MTRIRTAIFWLHLAAGVCAGLVVLIMSVTGVALTYEKQMLEWADRSAWSAPSSTLVERLSPETLLARVRDREPEAAPATLIVRADPAAPATVTLDGNRTLLVNPYTGAIIGAPPQRLRTFFRTMTSWHRYLALDGASRSTGKAITGAANLGFLFIVVSGVYLWWPRTWTWTQVKNVLWFRRGLPARARDFNWHNTIGFWSAVPLAIVVAGAVPISYPWASNLVYRVMGEEPPRPAGPPSSGPGGAARPGSGPERAATPAAAEAAPVTLDRGFVAATERVPGWRSISVRLAGGANAPLVFTIDEGYGGQPQKRGTLTLNRGSGEVERWETFGDLSPGRRLRSWLRFAHTGEIYGLPGQTIAGVVSAGGAVLVWTGISLALRRLAAWIGRRRRASPSESVQRAA